MHFFLAPRNYTMPCSVIYTESRNENDAIYKQNDSNFPSYQNKTKKSEKKSEPLELLLSQKHLKVSNHKQTLTKQNLLVSFSTKLKSKYTFKTISLCNYFLYIPFSIRLPRGKAQSSREIGAQLRRRINRA